MAPKVASLAYLPVDIIKSDARQPLDLARRGMKKGFLCIGGVDAATMEVFIIEGSCNAESLLLIHQLSVTTASTTGHHCCPPPLTQPSIQLLEDPDFGHLETAFRSSAFILGFISTLLLLESDQTLFLAMTAQLLPPIGSSTLGKRFDSCPYSLPKPGSFHSASASASAPSINTALQRPRQASPASILSFASVPLRPNDENLAPLRQHASVSRTSLPSVSSSHAPSCQQRSQLPAHDAYSRISTSGATLPHSRKVEKGEDEDYRPLGSVSNEGVSLLQNALEGIERYKNARSGTVAYSGSDTPTGPEGKSESYKSSTATKKRTFGNVFVQPGLPLQPADQTSAGAIDAVAGTNSSTPSEQTPVDHRKRLSTNSSGFVHTVKTASFSNGSFSLMSKSLFLGRSSETHALLSSHSRFSTDSERPVTNSSLDEGALRRSVRRRQILEELVATEETYIADLKALVYLMSTLLASASSISSHLRLSMQQNVLDLLHLHEQILKELHRAAFKAAARKWAEMISPSGLASPRQTRWRSLEPSEAGRLARIHRRTRSSIESHELSQTRARLVGAEEADVADLVDIFKSSVSNFFGYEEYCANHEIIAHDLQRHLPTLWTTYEAGIESLARSLISLDRWTEDSRKALTVGDLLIKPIQRICKYPLLFEDLLKQTPVSDCPSAHAEIDTLLQSLRDIVDAVNRATQSQDARLHIHRRWSLQARLNFGRILHPEHFRLLGNAILCGVLHVTFHTRHRVDGAYALCILYQNTFLVAFPAGVTGRFDITALINLSDLKIESASDGKGLLDQVSGVRC
jgi:RhoGEF domain